MKNKITIYTKKGEAHRYIEYYRIGTLDRWTIEPDKEDE